LGSHRRAVHSGNIQDAFQCTDVCAIRTILKLPASQKQHSWHTLDVPFHEEIWGCVQVCSCTNDASAVAVGFRPLSKPGCHLAAPRRPSYTTMQNDRSINSQEVSSVGISDGRKPNCCVTASCGATASETVVAVALATSKLRQPTGPLVAMKHGTPERQAVS